MLRFSLQKERGKVKSAAALNHFYFTIKLEQRLVGIFNNTPSLPAHSPLHPVSSFLSLVSFSVFIQIPAASDGKTPTGQCCSEMSP